MMFPVKVVELAIAQTTLPSRKRRVNWGAVLLAEFAVLALIALAVL